MGVSAKSGPREQEAKRITQPERSHAHTHAYHHHHCHHAQKKKLQMRGERYESRGGKGRSSFASNPSSQKVKKKLRGEMKVWEERKGGGGKNRLKGGKNDLN